MNADIHPYVLVVEDDVRLSELVRDYLRSNGMRAEVEQRGDRVLSRVQQEVPDVVILDLGLPGQDGFAVCRQLRASFAMPILMLTARDSDIDQVLGLELGADDYVIKPVEPRVLVARIQALLRRGRLECANDQKVLKFGVLTINPASRAVTLDGAVVPVSSNEFDLLYLLASRAGQVQSREALYRQLYRREYNGLDRTLDVRISHLRKKLGDHGSPERIRTVWGHGYLFAPDPW